MPALRARAGIRAPAPWSLAVQGVRASDLGHPPGRCCTAAARPLREWFWAAYLVTTHTPGMSALQLQRQLGIPRYETAWTLLQKLRRAMRRSGRERLRDTVEVDETYIGIRKDCAEGASWATGPWWSGPSKSGAVPRVESGSRWCRMRRVPR